MVRQNFGAKSYIFRPPPATKSLLFVLTKLLYIHSFHHLLAVRNRRLFKRLATAQFFHDAGAFIFTFELLESSFDVLAFFYLYDDHCLLFEFIYLSCCFNACYGSHTCFCSYEAGGFATAKLDIFFQPAKFPCNLLKKHLRRMTETDSSTRSEQAMVGVAHYEIIPCLNPLPHDPVVMPEGLRALLEVGVLTGMPHGP